MNVRILPAAIQDLAEGRDFYERQREGLGDYFLDSLSSDIDSLRLYGGIHSRIWDRWHRLLSKRFPFAIYYRLDGDTATIWAVLDCRRHPSWAADRLKG